MNTGNYRKAIDLFRGLLSIRPGLVGAHLGLGSALALLGDMEKAVASFSAAIEVSVCFHGLRYSASACASCFFHNCDLFCAVASSLCFVTKCHQVFVEASALAGSLPPNMPTHDTMTGFSTSTLGRGGVQPQLVNGAFSSVITFFQETKISLYKGGHPNLGLLENCRQPQHQCRSNIP